MDLQNKIAVVTGAASGLGWATCEALLAAGARVAAFDIDKERLASLKRTLGANVSVFEVDVGSEASIKAGIDGALAAFGGIHVGVNCAGILGPSKTISKGQLPSSESWDRVIAVNLTGTYHVIRHAAFAMMRNQADAGGERGVIINTASVAAWQGQMGQAAYSASKAGVIGMTLPIARDLAEHGIRVMSVAPGLFETAMSADMPPKVSQSIADNMILFPKRMGKAPEFAAFVVHIIENAYMNATAVSIDGGVRIGTR
jgi:NAD(P)-dependent dehydrogenase (short-subunit alcohol dehydrogenase family)